MNVSKEEIEKEIATLFLKAKFGSIDNLDVKFGDKPDAKFVIERKTIGLELAALPLKSGSDVSSRQRQIPLRSKCVQYARKLVPTIWRERELSFSFSEKFPIIDHRELGQRISEALNKLAPDNSINVLPVYSMKINELFMIYDAGWFVDSKWKVQNVFSTSVLPTVECIQTIIDRKNIRLKEYEKCDQQWLLLWMNYLDSTHHMYVDLEILNGLECKNFDQVLAFRYGYNDIWNICDNSTAKPA